MQRQSVDGWGNWGFAVLPNAAGGPVVSLTYETEAEARAAHALMDRAGSTSTKAPSRAKTKPARASLRPWPNAATVDINQSFQPEWIATTPPLRRVTSTQAKPAAAIMSANNSA